MIPDSEGVWGLLSPKTVRDWTIFFSFLSLMHDRLLLTVLLHLQWEVRRQTDILLVDAHIQEGFRSLKKEDLEEQNHHLYKACRWHCSSMHV